MKFLVFVFALAVAVATINATCLHCAQHKHDRQEIKYGDLRYHGSDLDLNNQYTDKSKNVSEKFQIIEKMVQKYPMYVEEAKQKAKFSDSLKLIDTTESLTNGDIVYRHAEIHGLESLILEEANFDDIEKNMLYIRAVWKKAEVVGDYAVAASFMNDIDHGQFAIALEDVKFNAKFHLDRFLEIQPEIDSEWITIDRHESMYTNWEALKGLDNGNTEIPKPYAFYYNYLNMAIKKRLASEMTVVVKPLIAKRLVQILNPVVLFPTKYINVPSTNAYIAPGVQAMVFNTILRDLSSTKKIQKMVNYTVIDQSQTKLLLSFTMYDLKGYTKWALEYSTGSSYNGKAMFTVDNAQTILMATKMSEQGKISLKFVKTIVNGLTMMLDNDDNCQSISELASERIPKVLEQSLEMFINDQSERVLRNQIALIDDFKQQ